MESMICCICKNKFAKGISYKGIDICFECDSDRWEQLKQEIKDESDQERRTEYLELIKEGIDNKNYDI